MRVVFEPTGPYHRVLGLALLAAGLRLVKVNPRSAQRFAEATGVLAKTDRIDASVMAGTGAILDLQGRAARTEIQYHLMELSVARQAQIKDRVAAKSRQAAAVNALLKRQLAARIKQIKNQLADIDAAILTRIQDGLVLATRFDILCGIGKPPQSESSNRRCQGNYGPLRQAGSRPADLKDRAQLQALRRTACIKAVDPRSGCVYHHAHRWEGACPAGDHRRCGPDAKCRPVRPSLPVQCSGPVLTVIPEFFMLSNATILVTGGTGSFGNCFVPMTLARFNPRKLIIFSRDEMKQWDMAKLYGDDPRVRFFIGDVRDRDRLYRAFDGVDYVVHAAATKIVPTAEYNPFECIKTNVNGAMNVIDAAIDKGVKGVVALSTDKASSPINLYGASKLASDKLFVAGNAYAGEHGTRFSVVRYGNVMGSRGSVIPLFRSLASTGRLPITDARMTRFMISLEQGVDLVWHAFTDMVGGEIYVKKIPSMKVTDIAKIVAPDAELDMVGIRPGEKLHEQMIGLEDAAYTYEYEDHFKILPAINKWSDDPMRIKDGVKVDEDFCYTSDRNPDWMSSQALSDWIRENSDKIGAI